MHEDTRRKCEPDLKLRTKKFAIDVIKLVRDFPSTKEGQVVGRQLLRAATSIGANYRACQRAKSTADFIAKMTTVEEEADECCFWLELTTESGILRTAELDALRKEADEITAMIVAAIKTAKRNRTNSNP